MQSRETIVARKRNAQLGKHSMGILDCGILTTDISISRLIEIDMI